mgnify:FL=1
MIGNLSYMAIAVPDLEAAIYQYQDVFGAFVTSPQDLPLHGIRIATVNLSNTKIQLITPLDGSSPLHQFLETHLQGGLHHLCYEVSDIAAARDQLLAAGLHPIDEGEPPRGYHGNPVLFFNPKDCFGILIKLEEIPSFKQQDRIGIGRIGPLHPSRSSSLESLKGMEGIGIGIEVDFKKKTPLDNMEDE